jgi:hypothetical protein
MFQKNLLLDLPNKIHFPRKNSLFSIEMCSIPNNAIYRFKKVVAINSWLKSEVGPTSRLNPAELAVFGIRLS